MLDEQNELNNMFITLVQMKGININKSFDKMFGGIAILHENLGNGIFNQNVRNHSNMIEKFEVDFFFRLGK